MHFTRKQLNDAFRENQEHLLAGKGFSRTIDGFGPRKILSEHYVGQIAPRIGKIFHPTTAPISTPVSSNCGESTKIEASFKKFVRGNDAKEHDAVGRVG